LRWTTEVRPGMKMWQNICERGEEERKKKGERERDKDN
jgi:hypothetical protein